MAEAENRFPTESTNTWSLDISFVNPSMSCALIAFTNLCAISVAATFFVRTLNHRLIRLIFVPITLILMRRHRNRRSLKASSEVGTLNLRAPFAGSAGRLH